MSSSRRGGGDGAPRSGPAGPLDCGNSGRRCACGGLLAAQPFRVVLRATSPERRPMRAEEPLDVMGARFAGDGHGPERRGGRPARYLRHVASARSSRASCSRGSARRGAPKSSSREQTRDHTERMLRWFGVPVETRDGSTRAGGRRVRRRRLASAARTDGAGDISSAPSRRRRVLRGSELELEASASTDARGRARRRRARSRAPAGDARARTSRPADVLGAAAANRREGANVILRAVGPEVIDELPCCRRRRHAVEGGLRYATRASCA